MNFEDLVDMDWLNSNTITDETFPVSPALSIKDEAMDSFAPGVDEYCNDHLYSFSDPQLIWQNDLDSTANLDLKLRSSLSSVPSPLPDKQECPELDPQVGIKMPELALPSTEHIKQLIEIAKQHLALREQQQRLQEEGVQTAYETPVLPLPLFTAEGADGAAPAVQLPDTVAPGSLMKPLAAPANTDDTSKRATSPVPSGSRSSVGSPTSSSAFAEETMTLEAYAESDGIDIKKLTPKERRQLRNKISARNFRVRRKEYINTLEAQVDDHKKHAERLKLRLGDVEAENKQLRLEVDTLRRQNQLLQQQQKTVAGSSSATSSDLTRTPSSPRVSSPIPKPNLNKDISMLGSKASDTYRQDTRILVSNAVMPDWNFGDILSSQQPKVPVPQDSHVMQFAGQILAGFVRLKRAAAAAAAASSTSPLSATTAASNRENAEKADIWDAPLLPDDRDFTSGDEKSGMLPYESSSYMEYLYDTLIMSALVTGSNVSDRSFWWWETNDV